MLSQRWPAATKAIVSRQAQTMHLHSCPFYRPRIEQNFSHGISKFTDMSLWWAKKSIVANLEFLCHLSISARSDHPACHLHHPTPSLESLICWTIAAIWRW
jgi:hypothetical protein